MISEEKNFVDEFGNIHEVDVELGRGGQGVVFRTQDPDIAIKLVLDANGLVKESETMEKKLRNLRLLPVPSNLPLAMPSAILREKAGYAMRLLNDMVPFKHFWPTGGNDVASPGQVTPSWLAGIPEEKARELIHYVETGGLQRRLLALYQCSAILGRLHAAGLVYGDVSAANAYVSKDLDSRAVWLIDGDNLRFETEGQGPGVYTPCFGAPELAQGLDGGRPRTDCHAIAVMAFWMLTLQHPFLGDYVENGPSSDWADDETDQEDLTEKAYAGLLPWIDDENDRSNATKNGLPRSLVLTGDLRRLFQETFGVGRTQPWRRPAMFHWPFFLARALDLTISCPDCRMGYFSDGDEPHENCPFCGSRRPEILRATAFGAADTAQNPLWTFSREIGQSESEVFSLPHRLFFPFSITDGDRDVLEISFRKERIILRRLDQSSRTEFSVLLGKDRQDLSSTVELSRESGIQGFVITIDGPSCRKVVFNFEKETS